MQDFMWPAEGLTRVPYVLYHDADIYQREQERIFRGPSWNYVGLTAEIPKPGDFIRSSVGDTPVIVVRSKDGEVGVVVNRCAHRGLQLCQLETGNAANFTCPYHQWSYDLTGKLRGIPFKKGIDGVGGMAPDFEISSLDLHKLAVTVRNGVIFASFSSTVPPFAEYMGEENLKYFDRVFDGRGLRVLGKHRQRISANWKLVMENIKDPYHATLLHVFFVTFRLWSADNEYTIKFDPTGGTAAQVTKPKPPSAAKMETKSLRENLKLADPRIVEAVKEYPDEVSGVMQTIWPNLIVQQTLNSLALRHAVPCGPNAFELHWTFYGYDDDTPEMTQRRLRHVNLYGPAGLVSCDDSEVLQLVQLTANKGPASHAAVQIGHRIDTATGEALETVDGMVTESMIRGFYKYYRKVMEM